MTKKLTKQEKKFAAFLAHGLRPVEAARKAFGWKCEPYTQENQKAKDLARAVRIKKEVARLEEIETRRNEVAQTLVSSHPDWDSIYTFAIEKLIAIRDDISAPSKTRYEAVEVLERIQDPSQDINLIWRYTDMVWNSLTAHCPCCHESFPLWKIKNKKLMRWRLENDLDIDGELEENILDRRLALLKKADKGNDPHPGQITALSTPNRHVVARGPARTGKSYTLAMFGWLFMMIPGVEIWLLARTYDFSEKELEYLMRFLSTAFYPVDKHMFTFQLDKKTGEARIDTKWGSSLRVKSSKSQGSITGAELEAILVAEPGWIDGDIFEEVRARMSSRLGRIISLGTPKGLGGFLGRLVRMTSRNMRTGKRMSTDERTVEGGCPWESSILCFDMKPQDNPAYVSSEIETARSELTATEFASEFEGLMVGDANLKFPNIKDEHLITVGRHKTQELIFTLGIDQGPANFGACLLGWDGRDVFTVFEFFDHSDKTIRANMIYLNEHIPRFIRLIGGSDYNWKLTIFDVDPDVSYELLELDKNGNPWKTEYTFRPKTRNVNWREDTCLWVDQMAKDHRLWFSAEHCDLLHEQLQEAMIRPVAQDSDTPSATKKRWVINDPWRGDHVADAFLLAAWTIFNQHLIVIPERAEADDPMEELRKAAEYKRLVQEKAELRGEFDPNDVFRDVFGRDQFESDDFFIPGSMGYYPDES